ncbi:hypothetical protein Ae201684P_004269 [Aphanomyces euteiches]|nr:hypothetical protein Ae201684P_004269 [Aphanomyces euteiches]
MSRELSFARTTCECKEPLFSYKYLRTHRAGSLKLIRCFPHCCPIHSYGNFCSASIDLVASNVDHAMHDVYAFARFQGAQEHVFQPDEIVPATMFLSSLRTPGDLKGEWLPSSSSAYNQSKKEMIFRLNENNSLGWHYGWVGSSTQAHRACLHYLVGYVVRHVSPNDTSKFQIVMSTASPPFIIMSYRRACYYCQKHRANAITNAKTECECEGEFNYKRSLTNYSSMNLNLAQSNENSTNPLTMERHLTILYAFLSMPSVHFFASQLQTLENRILKSLLQPMGASMTFNAYQRRSMPFPTSIVRPGVVLFGPVNTDLESLKAFCVDMAMSALTFGSLQQIAKFFSDNTVHLFERDSLYEAYIDWVRQTHRSMSTRLLPLSMTMGQLVSHLIVAATQISELKPVQGFLQHLDDSTDEHSLGFNYFVAQLREVFMAEETKPIAPLSLSERWMYDKTISTMYEESVPPSLDFSLATMFRCLTMAYSFQMYTDSHILWLKSDLNAFNTVWSEFYLDYEPRVFRVFPNGESSMVHLSGLYHGDYVGHLNLHDNSLVLELFSWPTSPSLRYALRVTILFQRVKEHVMELSITVARSEVGGTIDFSLLSATERYAEYNRDKEVVLASFAISYNRIKS